jgi:hypothetical protein
MNIVNFKVRRQKSISLFYLQLFATLALKIRMLSKKAKILKIWWERTVTGRQTFSCSIGYNLNRKVVKECFY